jgi:hypothetical protein
MEKSLVYKNYTIDIVFDNEAASPRAKDSNLTTIVCMHPSYRLGDKNHGFDLANYKTLDDLYKAIVKKIQRKDNMPMMVIKALYLSVEDKMSIHTMPAENRQKIGFTFIEGRKALEHLGVPKLAHNHKVRIYNLMEKEIEAYSNYLQDEVYGFRILDKSGVELYHEFGYLGEDHVDSGLLGTAHIYIDEIKTKVPCYA